MNRATLPPRSLSRCPSRRLRERLVELLPEIERAIRARPGTLLLESKIAEAGGRLICTPTAPQWLYLVTGDRGTEIFDVPTAVDMYNGNNPLKGKGGRNEQVTDDWLKHLAEVVTLRPCRSGELCDQRGWSAVHQSADEFAGSQPDAHAS
jgi:hypothetical protein